jgi:hypothetical protein
VTTATEQKGIVRKLGRWVAELILVFVGVYAAFWLNNFQQRQERTQRHHQILASLEQTLQEGVASSKEGRANSERTLARFQHAVQAGEMPPLPPFVFTTDYSPSDMATLLQAGGFDLLNLKTVAALREFETVVRWGLSRMAHYQKLSDELIVPNLDQDRSFFYDPATKQLRKRFGFYSDALEAEVSFFRELEAKEAQLLTQIQSERQGR